MLAEKLTDKVRNRVLGRVFVDRGADYRDSVFLAGTGRGGTTWVSEVINHEGEYRHIFEPFHPAKVGLVKDFRQKQYLRPEDRREKFLEPARRILSGRIRNGWTDRFHKRFVYDKRLVKDVRANLLLKWLHANFPEVPIVLLLRHPCAVAASRARLGWKGSLIETYLSQRELVEDFLGPFEQEIRAIKTDFERYIFNWCVENYVPLRQFREGEIHLVFYEHFCETPHDEVGRLFSFLGKEFDEAVFESLKRPSPLARRESAVTLGERSVSSWRKHISEEQVERAIEILGIFGLDGIYSGDLMPDTAAAWAMLKEG